jgi:hypothetical protein
MPSANLDEPAARPATEYAASEPQPLTTTQRPAVPRAAEPSPTVEPTPETVVVDVTAIPAALTQRTPASTATPRTTPAPAPTPEVAGVQSTSMMDEVLTQTLEPVLEGGRIGLIGGGLSLLSALAWKLLRGRKQAR